MLAHPYETILIPIASLSVASSLSVVLTLVLFREMRAKFFMQIVAFISISDAIANFPYMMFYRPPTGNWFCTVEGLINFTFYPMSWLWTLSLVYHLYGVATEKSLPSKLGIRFTHVFCWGIPIVLSLAGLSVTKYKHSEPIGFEVCYVSNQTSAIYHAIAFYGLLLVVLLALGILTYKTWRLEQAQDAGSFHPSYAILKDSVTLYPTAMVICWIPHLIAFSLYKVTFTSFANYEYLYFAVTILKILHGTFTAGIFFYKSESARRLWRKVFNCKYSYNDDSRSSTSSLVEQENPITLSFQIERSSSLDSSVRNTFVIV